MHRSGDDDDGDAFSPARITRFAATLVGLPADEVRKAKELYLRNAIADYRAQLAAQSSWTLATAIHWLVPLFWPMLFSFRRTQRIEAARQLERIRNAVEVWKDDLRGERFALPGGEVIVC